ncbi:MAG: hypothetical protein JST62_11490 [Bacteroidetes bacterium]|nr:hypothetical protein [Bacteroidota bacterium]
MRITNTQKQELAEIFRESGLNLLDFETSGQHKEFKVQYKHEYFSFYINIHDKDKNVYHVTVFTVSNTKASPVAATWEQVKGKFKVWTKEVFTELNTPTGWETFESENFLNNDFQELNSEFTELEKAKVGQSISELKEKIKLLELPEPTLDILNKKLDELHIKVDKLNKFDWKSLFIGTIASLIMTLAIPPQASGLIWEYIKSAFSGLKLKG